MTRRLVPWLLLVATIAMLVWHARQLQFFCDDSYISYRYSQNFAEGNGLVYNVGERVEGYTNFLWVILVGLGMKAGIAAEPASLWLGVFFLVVTLVTSTLLARRLFRSDAFALVPALLLVCQGPMVLWSVSGLEASCFAALTLVAIAAYERGFACWKGQLLAGVLYALSTMVRPDGVVFGAAAGLHLVLAGLCARPLALGDVARRAAALAAGFAALFVPFVLWRHSYYGDWLPNTFYVKAGGILNLRLGVAYLATWFGEYPLAGWLTLAGVASVFTLPLWSGRRRTFAHLALALLLFSGYLAWAGGDYMALYRFLVPLLPLAMLFATALLVTLYEGAVRIRVAPPAAAFAGLALLALAGWRLWLPTRRSLDGIEQSKAIATVKRMKGNSTQWVALGKALRGKLPPQFTIATTAAGALPYCSGFPTIDQSGLCDRHTAKEESDPWMLDRPGHMKQATRSWIAKRRPEVVFWHPRLELATRPPELFPTPPTPDYELRAMAVPELADQGICAFFWVRRDVMASLVPNGIVPAAESAQLAKAPAPGDGSEKGVVTKAEQRRNDAVAELKALDAEPPPAPPTVDPPPPPRHEGPVFATERIHAADPAADEPRISVGDVSRPLWAPDGAAEIEVAGAPGSYLEIDVASAPVEDPVSKRTLRLQGAVAPSSVAITLVQGGTRRALPTSVGTDPFAASRCWRTARADLGGVPAGRATLEMEVDGKPVGKSSGWLVSVPRICQRPEDSSSRTRPNVLIVTIDTLRADYLGCYGHDRPTSPQIDALARQGVLFEHAVSQASWTLPSYSSTFSGLFVESHGVVHRDHMFAHRLTTFVEKLAQAGYATGGIVSGTFTDAFWGFDQGFDSYDDLGMVVDESKPDRMQGANGGDPTGKEAMELGSHRRITSPEVANKAIAWLDAHRDQRFALFLHFFDPHEDYLKHPGVSERFPVRAAPADFPNPVDTQPAVTATMRALYEGEIAYTDQHVGRVLARLEQLGLADETIVVVFADHGEAFKEHVLSAEDDTRNHGHGSSLFNEQVHVPLIFRVPGVAPGRVATPVGNIDIGPTLLDLCGADVESWPHQGQSLKPMFDDHDAQRDEPVLAAQYAMNARDNAPPGVDVHDERIQVAHRLDHGDHCAIEYARGRGGEGATFLFAVSDRWQDYANNLVATMGDAFERFRAYYARRRPQLEALVKPASTVDTTGVDGKLKRLGYGSEKRE